MFSKQHRHLHCKVAVLHRVGQKWGILIVKNVKNIFKCLFCSEFIISSGREGHFFSSLGFSLLLWAETWKSFRSQLKHFSVYGNHVLIPLKWSGQIIFTSFGKKLVRLSLVCFAQTTHCEWFHPVHPCRSQPLPRSSLSKEIYMRFVAVSWGLTDLNYFISLLDGLRPRELMDSD